MTLALIETCKINIFVTTQLVEYWESAIPSFLMLIWSVRLNRRISGEVLDPSYQHSSRQFLSTVWELGQAGDQAKVAKT